MSVKASALRTWLRKERAREVVEGRDVPLFPSEDDGTIAAFVVREHVARRWRSVVALWPGSPDETP